MIDEFQDCHGPLLDFVKAVSSSSSLLLAADDFQLLDTKLAGCPALEWTKELTKNGTLDVTELTKCHRTSIKGILEAARCLRQNVKSSVPTVPVYTCPNPGPAAWKMIESLILNTNRWTGPTALICPSNDPFIRKVLMSCDAQLRKRQCLPIQWHVECSIEEEQKQIRQNLGLIKNTANWVAPSSDLDPVETHIAANSHRFARLKGMTHIPKAVVERQVDRTIHDRRAYTPYSHTKTVTTVHGAKNREFNNVFVLWTYKLPPDQLQQRRLLYNAVTRAMTNCIVLVLGNDDRAFNDPILNLLGPAKPVFSGKGK
jgi:hypothetical protein